MRIVGRRDPKAAWRAALLTGLATSNFSTLVAVLGAPRIGRGAALTWMEVATSAAEYYLILPWLQPLVTMQTPYWIPLGVHLSSTAAYPLFPWLRARDLGREGEDSAFARRMAAALGGVLVLLAALEALARTGRELRWPFAGPQARAFDRAFMRRMTAHHEVGIALARLAAKKAVRDELRTLGRLMVAEQRAEIDTLQRWWRGWFTGDLSAPTPEEHAAMPGMPPPGAVEELAA